MFDMLIGQIDRRRYLRKRPHITRKKTVSKYCYALIAIFLFTACSNDILSSPDVETDLSAVTLSQAEALSYLALVNQNIRLSSDFSPNDLTVVNVLGDSQHLLRVTAAYAIEDLFHAALEEGGYFLLIVSAYRSYATQVATHDQFIEEWGVVEARRISAQAGHSEHQLGLAVDISTLALGGQLSEAFSDSAEGHWVRENAHRFGFIVRYPQNREADTGFVYEPWHLRYVGVDAATEMFYHGLILEEYLEIINDEA